MITTRGKEKKKNLETGEVSPANNNQSVNSALWRAASCCIPEVSPAPELNSTSVQSVGYRRTASFGSYVRLIRFPATSSQRTADRGNLYKTSASTATVANCYISQTTVPLSELLRIIALHCNRYCIDLARLLSVDVGLVN